MSELRIGIIGTGFMATRLYAPAVIANERATLGALCRRDEAKLRMAQQKFQVDEAYTDWRQMLQESNLDAVIICTPHDLHAAPTLAALERGLHVLVEKPLANHGTDARAMCAGAESSGRVLMVTYNYRFSGMWRTVKEVVAGGEIGPVRQISLTLSINRHFIWEDKRVPDSMFDSFVKTAGMPEGFFENDFSADWRSSYARNGGGTFNNAGSHWTDLLLWLAGAPPTQVSALTDPAGQEVEYFISVLARLANDVQLAITFADAIPKGSIKRLAIIGDLGFVESDERETRIHANGETRLLEPKYDNVSPVDCFVDCILDGGRNPCPGEEAAHTVFLTEAAYQSARERNIVAIAPS